MLASPRKPFVVILPPLSQLFVLHSAPAWPISSLWQLSAPLLLLGFSNADLPNAGRWCETSQPVLSLLGVCSHLSEESRAAKARGRKSETSKRRLQTSLWNRKKRCTAPGKAHESFTGQAAMKPSSSLGGLLASPPCLRFPPADAPLHPPHFPGIYASASLSCSSLCLHAISVQPHLQAQIQIAFSCPWWFTDLLPCSIYPSGGLSFWRHPKDTSPPDEAQRGGNRAAQLTALGRTAWPQEHAACPTGIPRRRLWLRLLLTSSVILFFSGYHLYTVAFHLLSAKIPVQASGILNLNYSHLFFFLASTNTVLSNLYPAQTLLRASFPHGCIWLCCCCLCPPSPALLRAAEAPSLCSQGPPVHHSLTRYNFCPQLTLNMSFASLVDRFSDKHLCPFTPTTPQAWDGHTTNTRAAAPLSSVKIIIKSLRDALRKSLLWTVPVLSSFLICRMLLFRHFLLLSLLFSYSVISHCPCLGAKLSSTGPIFFP